jgi:hypothetical protein
MLTRQQAVAVKQVLESHDGQALLEVVRQQVSGPFLVLDSTDGVRVAMELARRQGERDLLDWLGGLVKKANHVIESETNR